MYFHILSLFPQLFESALSYGVVGRAWERGQIQVECTDIRDSSPDRHRRVDDRPFGGGPGMVMRPDVVSKAIHYARCQMPVHGPVIYLSPQGERLVHRRVSELAQLPGLILLCGRYEGIDERAIQAEVDAELSIGDYVLSGGEFAALVVIDAVARLQPKVLGDAQSAAQDSFGEGLLDWPHYTWPREFEGCQVPEVLLSGDHGRIAAWRLKQALGRTFERRPEWLEARGLSPRERELLEEYLQECGKGPRESGDTPPESGFGPNSAGGKEEE